MAGVTTTLRLGTCVTNPATREPSVTASTLAVARRDQRRTDGPRHRPRRLGAAGARQAADDDGAPRGGHRRHQEPRRGSRGDVRGHRAAACRGPAAGTLPVWVAGYGPMAIEMTGRVADGIILQLADPDLIRWFVGQLREAAADGRPRSRASLKVQAAAPAHIGPREVGRATDALVPGAGLEPRRGPRQRSTRASNCPSALTGYIQDRSRLRLPPPRRGRLGRTRPSWATR